MIDLEPRLREQLDRWVPPPDPGLADWDDALRRARVQRRPRRRAAIVGALLFAAAALALAATPLGGAVARAIGGFSGWLSGEPGTPAPAAEQQRFAERARQGWTSFPGRPQLRQLLRVRAGAATYTLYGFRAGSTVCLRLVPDGLRGAGPVLACAPVAELRAAGELAIALKANVGLGSVGARPRTAADPPSVPRALVVFGLAAAELDRLVVVSDRRRAAARVANGAFLYVLNRPGRGEWLRRTIATDWRGRRQQIPILVGVSHEPALARTRRASGPTTIERRVVGGTIGWFVQRDLRGSAISAAQRAQLNAGPRLRVGDFARLIQPGPQDFLRMLIAERQATRPSSATSRSPAAASAAAARPSSGCSRAARSRSAGASAAPASSTG